MQVRAGRYCGAILLLAGMCAASIPQSPVPRLERKLTADVDSMLPMEQARHCSAMLAPRPLATPLPAFLKGPRANLKLRFVIGRDGRLHHVVIVNSAGRAADSRAVRMLRQWRYEPATCSGIPMEAEGIVEFPGRN